MRKEQESIQQELSEIKENSRVEDTMEMLKENIKESLVQ